MKTRYQESQIEDVAQILKSQISSALPLNWVGHIAETETNATVKRLAHRFADLFAADNPNFDRDRFLSACGLESEPEYCPKCDKTVSDCAEEGCGINFTGEGNCACREVQPQIRK